MNNNDELLQNEDFGPDILTLTSDDGEEFQFEMLDRDEIDGTTYVALVPIVGDNSEEVADDEEDELVFLKVVEENDDEFLESIEDEDEYNRVSDYFTERLSEFFDIE